MVALLKFSKSGHTKTELILLDCTYYIFKQLDTKWGSELQLWILDLNQTFEKVWWWMVEHLKFSKSGCIQKLWLLHSFSEPPHFLSTNSGQELKSTFLWKNHQVEWKMRTQSGQIQQNYSFMEGKLDLKMGRINLASYIIWVCVHCALYINSLNCN